MSRGEAWRWIPGWKGHYLVSNHGRIVSLPQQEREPVVLAGYISANGYPIAVLHRDDRKRTAAVHVLVLEAFMGPRPPGHVCRHLNGIATDNRLANLCWGTQAENIEDSKRHGTYSYGETKLNESKVLEIRRLLAAGVTHRKVAAMFGISRSYVSHIKSRKAWARIKATEANERPP